MSVPFVWKGNTNIEDYERTKKNSFWFQNKEAFVFKTENLPLKSENKDFIIIVKPVIKIKKNFYHADSTFLKL